MIIHGWTRIAKLIVLTAMTALLSGCHTAQVGAPHPFTTMFEQEPPRPQDQVVRAQYLLEYDSPPAMSPMQTASEAIDSVH